MILATWLSQAAAEEQTSILLVALKAHTHFLCLAYGLSHNLLRIE